MTARIYLVEDDDDIAESLKIRLRTNGFEVLRASSGEGAVAAVRDYDPDLLMLDISIPGDDGISVAGHLDEALGAKRPPIIFLTASMREDLVDRAAGIERSRFMSKPFKSEELVAAIQQTIVERTSEQSG